MLAGLPLGDPRQHTPAVMVNLLGDIWFAARDDTPREPDWTRVLAHPRAKLHLYGKAEPRRGRKMGHVTCLAPTLDDALATARAIKRDARDSRADAAELIARVCAANRIARWQTGVRQRLLRPGRPARFLFARRTAPTGQRRDARVLRIVVAAAGRDVVRAPSAVASAPQKSSSPIASVGTPNTPRAIASSVLRRSASFTSAVGDARVGVGRRRARASSSAHSIGRSGSRPSRQTKRKIRCTASGAQSQAIASRSSGSGLNGCSGGNLSGMPSRFACQTHEAVGERALAPEFPPAPSARWRASSPANSTGR